ncbi:MAG TPA: hypothetical protein VFG72_09860 [Marmoricola sp.]|nr:hypothetical protein [Marmoricola sp.]
MLPSTSLTPIRSSDAPPLTFAGWTDDLRAQGFVVLPQSHAVPVDLWLREPTGRVLHLRARGTRVALRAYEGSDFTTVLLRAECDCEEHRTAGAAGRIALTPGAQPMAEAEYDGAAEAGWTGAAAGRLGVVEAAELFVLLSARLPGSETLPGAGASTVQPDSTSREGSPSCPPSSVLAPARAG